MRRLLTALALLTATCTGALLGLPSATAVHPTFAITLNPTAPNPSEALAFSGHCDNADAIGKPIHIRLWNVADHNTLGEVDVVVDAGGDYSGSFSANWAPVPGHFQVLGVCPLQSTNDGYQASPVFAVPMGLTVQTMSVQTSPGDADQPLELVVDVSGAGCDGKAVIWTVLDGSLQELASGTADPGTDGNWSAHVVQSAEAPFDGVRHGYAYCVGGEEVLALYATVTEPTPDSTSTTLPNSPSTSAPTPISPAPAAAAVTSNPTYTG